MRSVWTCGTHCVSVSVHLLLPEKGEEVKFEKRQKRDYVRTVIVVVTHDHLLGLPVLAHLAPEILVEGVEVVLQLACIHLVLRIVGGVLVEVGK